jgi:predicted amidohydrolase
MVKQSCFFEFKMPLPKLGIGVSFDQIVSMVARWMIVRREGCEFLVSFAEFRAAEGQDWQPDGSAKKPSISLALS